MIGDDQDVTIEASTTNGTIKSEDAVSFGLIVTELVINSLKHGFPGGRKGQIVVAYVKDGAGWRLTVSDDGVGRLRRSRRWFATRRTRHQHRRGTRQKA